MLRAILSILGGYVTMFVLVFVTFTIAYTILGTDGSFKPATFEPSGTWIAISFVLGFLAAIVGGMVCATIARTPRPPRVLAVLVIVLGLIISIPTLTAPSDPAAMERPDDVGNFEAMQSARQPAWVSVVNPFLGALGVTLGAGMRRRQPA
jgi:hypothetical protein